MSKKWLLRVDRHTCVGAGACAAASDAFALDDDYRSSPVAERVDPDPKVLAAARACPVDAISITDAETGASVYP
jgi:ferredoxin